MELQERIKNLKAATPIHYFIHAVGRTDEQKELIFELHDKKIKWHIIQDIIIHKRGIKKLKRRNLRIVTETLQLNGYDENEIKRILLKQ